MSDTPEKAHDSDPSTDRRELEELRDRIVALDREIVRRVGERRELVLRIGRLKEALGMPVLDPGREAAVVRRAAELAREEGVDEEMVRDVLWRVIASARDAQEERDRWGPPEPTGTEEPTGMDEPSETG